MACIQQYHNSRPTLDWYCSAGMLGSIVAVRVMCVLNGMSSRAGSLDCSSLSNCMVAAGSVSAAT